MAGPIIFDVSNYAGQCFNSRERAKMQKTLDYYPTTYRWVKCNCTTAKTNTQ